MRAELDLEGRGDVTAVRTVADDIVELDLVTGTSVTVTIDRSRFVSPSPLTCKGPGDQDVPTYRLVDIRTR